MFIIAAARREKNVGEILLFLAATAGTVCINLNGNCGDVSRPAAPLSLFQNLSLPGVSSFLNNSPTFRCLLSRGAFLISRSFHHLFPARAVVDDDLTLSSRKLRMNVDHLLAATENSRAYHGKHSKINNIPV